MKKAPAEGAEALRDHLNTSEGYSCLLLVSVMYARNVQAALR